MFCRRVIRKSFFFVAIVIILLLLYSCSFRGVVLKPSPKPISYKEASLQELLDLINERAQMINTLKASLGIDFRPTSSRNYKSCKGRLLLEKPEKIRLKGYRSLLPTFFLLVSDGNSYWLSIPSKKKAYFGQVEDKVVSEDLTQEDIFLTPSHIIDSLLLDEIELNDSRKAFLEILPEMYIINIIEIDAEGDIFSERRIWVEREDLNIHQHQWFDSKGRLISKVSFRQFKKVSGIKLPGLVFIHRPWEGVYIRLLFNNINLNAAIEPEAFKFSPPKELNIINLSHREAVNKIQILNK